MCRSAFRSPFSGILLALLGGAAVGNTGIDHFLRSGVELAKNALADAESGLTDAEKEAIRQYADAYKEG